jgi:pimeloyl-ACP methyl ester carboxylesterase
MCARDAPTPWRLRWHATWSEPAKGDRAMPFVRAADRTALFYQDRGDGPPIVFIHGWAIGADMWEYQTTPLSRRGLRCIAYDRRGCGRSDHPDRGYDFDTFADDLAALLEHLDLRDVTLVGHSMGGGEVARYLSRHGARRIARAVLVGTITPFLRKTADNPDGVDDAVFAATIAALGEDRPAFLTAGAAGFFGAGLPGISVSPELMAWAVGLFLRASPSATIDMVRAFSTTDFRPDMPAFTVPTLVIHGDADANAPLALTGARTARAIVVYEGAPHGLFVTHKARFNEDLAAFVGR